MYFIAQVVSKISTNVNVADECVQLEAFEYR